MITTLPTPTPNLSATLPGSECTNTHPSIPNPEGMTADSPARKCWVTVRENIHEVPTGHVRRVINLRSRKTTRLSD
jgi:hypothetical protein